MNQSTLPSDDHWLFPRLWAAFVLALIAVTWRLWFPAGDASFPTVSLLGPEVGFAPALGWVSSLILAGGLLALVMDPFRFRRAWWLVGVALAISFVIDQHRLQPWAYQTAVYAVALATLERKDAQRFLVVIGASVYLYSALGKFDFQFLHTVGQDFLSVVAAPLGGIPEDWTIARRAKMVALFPIMELVIGIGLLVPPTRRIFAVAVMGMHVTLLWILGPWGLDHSTGVLVWNALLLAQGYALFFRSRSIEESASTSTRPAVAKIWINAIVAAGVLIAPLLERTGYWDHWLSWSLYSPHTSRVELEIHQTGMERLSDEMSMYVEPDTDGDQWHRLAMDQWSLHARGVPIYPQARYQLGLVVALGERHELEEELRVRVRGVSDRWKGLREESRAVGMTGIREQRKRYWLWLER